MIARAFTQKNKSKLQLIQDILRSGVCIVLIFPHEGYRSVTAHSANTRVNRTMCFLFLSLDHTLTQFEIIIVASLVTVLKRKVLVLYRAVRVVIRGEIHSIDSAVLGHC